jgi:oxygen-independent coproporphyrinogen III oxidase
MLIIAGVSESKPVSPTLSTNLPNTGDFRSIYVHLPFCEVKCHYCDFYSIPAAKTSNESHSQFESSLLSEISLIVNSRAANSNAGHSNPIETVFFGGGTPSMSSVDLIGQVISLLKSDFGFAPGIEISMEMNPSSITEPKLKALKDAGINRVSMGVQSLDNNLLKWLGRVHDQNQALKALDCIFAAGFENVSTDLICGVPNQTIDNLKSSIHQLFEFPLTHMSIYLLTLSKAHSLAAQLPPEKTQLEHLDLIHQEMDKRGLIHYEVSNFCRPNRQARHNMNYWKRKSYLGLGPSAHSFDSETNQRWRNCASLKRYQEDIKKGVLPIDFEEKLNSDQIRLEKWMLALRLDEGFPKTWVETVSPNVHTQILSWKSQNWLEKHPTNSANYRLTPLGFTLSDQLALELSAIDITN